MGLPGLAKNDTGGGSSPIRVAAGRFALRRKLGQPLRRHAMDANLMFGASACRYIVEMATQLQL
jgi:hypothetical protein